MSGRKEADHGDSSRSPATAPNKPSHPMRLGPTIPSTASSHRQSFSEIRGLPPSPRTQRQPSFSHGAVQDLVDNPPVAKPANAFIGRDWRGIQVGELVSEDDVWFVSLDTGVEAATELLIDSEAPVVLIRESPNSKTAIGTFDYSDLNAYLLLVVGVAKPEEGQVSSFKELVNKAMLHDKIPLRDIKDLELGKKEPFVTLSRAENLMKAVEIFGSGIHRILIVEEGTTQITGILSQLTLVKFLWENGRSFPAIDQLYPQHLKDLAIGSMVVIGINGDRPVADALKLMNDEGVTSVAVIDNQHNVIGNISTVDVKSNWPESSRPQGDKKAKETK
ncbi:MAG: cell separation during budding [Candelina mexicana]|nr:MAG: cell separation during budding [Candelina mexicana]